MNQEEKFRKAYFDWLLTKVDDFFAFDPKDYTELLSQLHTYIFTPKLKMDGNRVADAYGLKGKFYTEVKDEYDVPEWKIYDWLGKTIVTMLELFVSCALVFSEHGEMFPTGWIFFQFLRNMGLSPLDDDFYNWYIDTYGTVGGFDNKIFDIVKAFNDMTYQPNGKGGMFVSFKDGDIRENEIKEQYDFFYRDFVRPIMDTVPDLFYYKEPEHKYKDR